MLTVAILAGGFATRLHPILKDIPKSMIDICGKPFIDWQLSLLSDSGVKRVVLCTSYKSEKIEEYVGNGSKYGIEVRYSKDGPTQLGTGGAIKKATEILEENFMVLYGDSYLPINYSTIQNAFQNINETALMTIYKNDNAFDTSNVNFENGKVKKYSKTPDSIEFRHIDFGLSIFNKSIFNRYSLNKNFDLSDVFSGLCKDNQLAAFEVKERFYEVGSVSGIRDLSDYINRSKNVL
jgi:N-acetyl-alpha-D-muramate 1-phosphate uridylyltransferase